MSTFNLRKFTNPDWLASIAPHRLLAFLARWDAYLSQRGFRLQPEAAAGVDCAALSSVLMSPDSSTPADLIDALYFIHETSSPEVMEDLLQDAENAGLHLSDDPLATPADVAIEVWLKRPAILQARHAQSMAIRQQSFDYFAGTSRRGRSFPAIYEAIQKQIETELDDWFQTKRRGRGSRLMHFRQGHLVWLLVRHGQTMRREASHSDDGSAGAAIYRPQVHDALVYDERSDEIGVHAGTLGEKRLYLRTLGKHLFGDEAYFPSAPRFTLQPLCADGPNALEFRDVPGIHAIRLVEYRLFWPGAYKEQEVRRATDIFAAAAARGRPEAIRQPPSAAVFKVQFEEGSRERKVTIRTPASARYERNEDGVVIEAWLRARGFMLKGPSS